jgi:hypothetical protein
MIFSYGSEVQSLPPDLIRGFKQFKPFKTFKPFQNASSSVLSFLGVAENLDRERSLTSFEMTCASEHQ